MKRRLGHYAFVKRTIDLVGALLLVILLAPIMVATAALVRWKIGTPVLFTQQRPGRGGRPFMLHKFRTMADTRDDEGRPLPDEQRLGSFGKALRRWSLDELPQLLNVLKGDMSFIGPRPLLMSYLPLYDHEQMRRMDVRPGITGWAQVRGRNSVNWEQRFRDDVFYVDNMSLGLDLRIALQTVCKVASGDGVSADGHVTMAPFTGNPASRVDIPANVCEAPARLKR